EAWLRDQKLNTIHEGTTGIQSMDLLGRKVVAQGGEPLRLLGEEIASTIAQAKRAGVDHAWCDALGGSVEEVERVTTALASLGIAGDVDGMMRHSADYLEMFAIVIVGWMWLKQAAVAKAALARGGQDAGDFYEGKLCAAQYWVHTEVSRVPQLAALCASG